MSRSAMIVVALSGCAGLAHAGIDAPEVTAQTGPAPTHTLERLIQTAYRNNPTLQQALADVERTRGRRFQSTRYPNPTAGYQASEVGNDGNAGQQGLFLSQEFVTAGKLGLNDQVYGWDVQQALWSWKTQQFRVANSVRLRHVDLLAARRTVQVWQQIESSAQNAHDVAETLLEVGEIPHNQLLQATVELRRAKLNAINSETVLLAAGRRLAAMVGVPDLDVASLAGDLNLEPPQLEFDSALNRLTEASPQLHAARATVARTGWATRRAGVEPIPNLESQLVVQYDDSTTDTIAGVQLGMRLPVFDRNRGNIRATHGERIRASFEIRRLELALRDRLAVAFQNYTAAARSAHAFRDSLLPLTRENLELTLDGFRIGESSYLQLLTAQHTWFDTVLDDVEARRRLWQSVISIQGLLVADGLAAPGASADPVSRSGDERPLHPGDDPLIEPMILP